MTINVIIDNKTRVRPHNKDYMEILKQAGLSLGEVTGIVAKPGHLEVSLITASYEVPPSGTLIHIRSGPPHLGTYANCCQVSSVQVEPSLFICVERSKQNGLHLFVTLQQSTFLY